jgi:DNA-binding transcriptional LysR family regulator
MSSARSLNVEINIRFQSTNGQMIKEAVRSGIYAVQTPSITSAVYADPGIQTSHIVDPVIPIHTYVVAARGRSNSRAVEAIRGLICELLEFKSESR